MGWLWRERTRGECLLVARDRRRGRGTGRGHRGIACQRQNVPARRGFLADQESDERKPGDRDAFDQWPTTARLKRLGRRWVHSGYVQDRREGRGSDEDLHGRALWNVEIHAAGPP